MLKHSIRAPALAASSAMTRAALVLAVIPMTRPARCSSQARANAAMTWVLPVPAGASRQLISRCEVSRPGAGLPLGVVQVRAGDRRGGGLRADPPRHRQHRDVDHPLLVVPVLGGAEHLLARRPVDRRPVLPQPEAGHVDDVGHWRDLQHGHVLGPPGQRLLGELVQVCLRVGVRRQRRQRPAELEHQLRPVPHRVLPLHLGDGDPDCAGPLRAVRQFARRVLRLVGGDCFVKPG